MTRFEATEILRKNWGFSIKDDNISPRWVEVFVQLGMLKLDEPKSLETEFVDALQRCIDHSDIAFVLGALKAAKLKLERE